jgi:hypothetical protein
MESNGMLFGPLPGIALAPISVLAIVSLSSCESWKRIERKTASDPFERVVATFQTDVDTVRKTLLELPRIPHHSQDILDRFPELGVFSVAERGDPIFPGDGAIRVNLDRSPWLEIYLGLPESTRTQDLYLYSVMDLFWPSEYIYQDKPAKFYSDFVLHLEPVDDTATRAEVFEYLPRIWVGKSFQLGAHGPCMCWDQRRVEQTRSDRVALLQAIEEAIEAGREATQ